MGEFAMWQKIRSIVFTILVLASLLSLYKLRA